MVLLTMMFMLLVEMVVVVKLIKISCGVAVGDGDIALTVWLEMVLLTIMLTPTYSRLTESHP